MIGAAGTGGVGGANRAGGADAAMVGISSAVGISGAADISGAAGIGGTTRADSNVGTVGVSVWKPDAATAAASTAAKDGISGSLIWPKSRAGSASAWCGSTGVATGWHGDSGQLWSWVGRKDLRCRFGLRCHGRRFWLHSDGLRLGRGQWLRGRSRLRNGPWGDRRSHLGHLDVGGPRVAIPIPEATASCWVLVPTCCRCVHFRVLCVAFV
jgi:hypothetical protein